MQKAFNSLTPSNVHVSVPLSQLSVSYMSQAPGFVAGKIFPVVPVQKQADRWYVWDNDHVRDVADIRAPGTESAGGSMKPSQDSYFCDVFAWHTDIPDQVQANADSAFQLDAQATAHVTNAMLLRREVQFIDTFFKKDPWDFSADGAGATSGPFDPTDDANNDLLRWSDASSDPVRNIRDARRTITQYAGASFAPNGLALGRAVYDALIDHPDIVARLDRGQTPGGPAKANAEALAALFEVDWVAPMDAIINNAAEGLDADMQFIAGNSALLCYAPKNPGLFTPSAGYVFNWIGYSKVPNVAPRIKKFYMDAIESTRVEGSLAFDMRVVSSRLGYFFNDII